MRAGVGAEGESESDEEDGEPSRKTAPTEGCGRGGSTWERKSDEVMEVRMEERRHQMLIHLSLQVCYSAESALEYYGEVLAGSIGPVASTSASQLAEVLEELPESSAPYQLWSVCMAPLASRGRREDVLMTDYFNRVETAKVQFYGWPVYVSTIWALKVSLLILYTHVTQGLTGSYRIRIRWGAAFVAVGFVVSILTIFLTCLPMSRLFSAHPFAPSECPFRGPVWFLASLW